MDWGFITAFWTNRQTETMNYWTRCDARISRKTKKRESDQSREQERFFFLFRDKNLSLPSDRPYPFSLATSDWEAADECYSYDAGNYFLPSLRLVSKYAQFRNILTTMIVPKVDSAFSLWRSITTLVDKSCSNSVVFNKYDHFTFDLTIRNEQRLLSPELRHRIVDQLS